MFYINTSLYGDRIIEGTSKEDVVNRMSSEIESRAKSQLDNDIYLKNRVSLGDLAEGMKKQFGDGLVEMPGGDL